MPRRRASWPPSPAAAPTPPAAPGPGTSPGKHPPHRDGYAARAGTRPTPSAHAAPPGPPLPTLPVGPGTLPATGHRCGRPRYAAPACTADAGENRLRAWLTFPLLVEQPGLLLL